MDWDLWCVCVCTCIVWNMTCVCGVCVCGAYLYVLDVHCVLYNMCDVCVVCVRRMTCVLCMVCGWHVRYDVCVAVLFGLLSACM